MTNLLCPICGTMTGTVYSPRIIDGELKSLWTTACARCQLTSPRQQTRHKSQYVYADMAVRAKTLIEVAMVKMQL